VAYTPLPGWPRINFQIAFNAGGLSSQAPYWTDLTARLQGTWTADLSGRQNELDVVESGTASFTVDGTDGALDSLNTAGPYYGSIKPLRRVRITATWPPTANQLDQALATGASATGVKASAGTLTVATVAAAPSGQTSAIAWAVPTGAAQQLAQGTSTSSLATSDPAATPVAGQPGQAAGQSWTGSLYVSAAAGGQSGLQVQASLSWYSQAGTLISTTTGAAVTLAVQSSWSSRVTVSGAAPAGAVWVRVALATASSVTTATTVYATGWQLEQAAAASAWVDPGATTSLWSGYIEQFVQNWDGTARGTVDISAVDVLAGLSKVTLQPSFQQSLQALGPNFLYAFNEQAGATSFADSTGQRGARTAQPAPNGGAGGSVTAGTAVTGTGMVGAPGPVTTISNPSPGIGTSSNAWYITAPASGPLGPPESGGWTRVIAFRTTVVPAVETYLWISLGAQAEGATTGSQAQLVLYITSTGHVFGYIVSADGSHNTVVSVPDVAACDGNWHLIVAQLTADGLIFSLIVDNHGYASGGGGDLHTAQCVSDAIGAQIVYGGAFFTFSGDIAFAAEFPYPIGTSAAFDLASGFALGWQGETSQARAQRILTMSGYSGPLATLDTQEAMGGANLAGSSALAALQLVAASEAGQVYADGAGTVTLAGRRWRYLQTSPSIVFGEHTGSGEVPYTGAPKISLDTDHVYNTIKISNRVAPNTPQPPDAYAANAVSQQEYFQASLSRDINVADQTEPGYAAAYLAQQYGEPMPRVDAVTIDPSANPALWPAVLGLAFGQRSRLMRRPNNAPAIQLETFVEKIEWHGDDQGHLTVSLQQSPAAPYTGWLIAAALHTTLASGATAGTNTITLAPLNGAANSPASAALPAGTVLAVGYGTAAAENATVLSVAATSPGYTSVVVTLTANLTANHASGAVVCQPHPATDTLPAGAAYPTCLDAGATLTAVGGPRVGY
jgi:hypothetical protein